MKEFIKIIFIPALILSFCAGIFIANTSWFNNTFYIKSRQMESLEIKSLKSYDDELFIKAKTQIDLNIASSKRYKHYHEYYQNVVERIKNIKYLDDISKNALINYIADYEDRKIKMSNVVFPNNIEESLYGTVFDSVYPAAMLEFDRQELLTYRMILMSMYNCVSKNEINKIFEE